MLDPKANRRRRVPPLPGERIWHELTLEWWRDLWRSPMASEFLPADRHSLYRLAVLVDAFWLEPSKELAAEIAREQQAFGLTPLDRRRLEWVLDDEPAVMRAAPAPAARPEPAQDPRAALRAVK